MPELRFESRLESDQEACFIRVAPEVLSALGQGKRVPVKVTINGYTYRTTIAVYGGQYYLGVRREVREAAGVAAGDRLTVGLEYDAELRVVDLPEGLRTALQADPEAAAGFDKLSHTHKKELVQWVTGAKRAEAQRRRMEQAMAMLRRPPVRR
ncbi:MAG TPA: YdeI/OmpD-associated family protein [Candidatus Dormibacteraeota bacterium]|nr:YdeI/OmpD-associated family protein [Candidatus Dormibacteraeota bacterium]